MTGLGAREAGEQLAGTAERQVTSHAVTNSWAEVDGDRPRVSALVDAVHIARDAPAARFGMMNRYDAELRRRLDV